jgi:cyclic-di-AMP phosphodiesterase PgpH
MTAIEIGWRRMKILKRWKLRKIGLKKAVKRKTEEKHPILNKLEYSSLTRYLTMLGSVVVIILLLVAGKYYAQPKLSQGQTAHEDVLSSIDFRYKDNEKTSQLREKRALEIPQLFSLDQDRIHTALSKISRVKNELLKATTSDTEKAEEHMQQAQADLRLILNIDQWDEQDSEKLLSTQELGLIVSSIESVFNRQRETRFFVDLSKVALPKSDVNIVALSKLKTQIDRETTSALDKVDKVWTKLAEKICASLLQSNNFIQDADLQRKIKNNAREGVEVQFSEIKTGDRVIGKNEVVDDRHMLLLKAMQEEIHKRRSLSERWLYVLGISMVVLLLTAISYFYFKNFHVEIFKNNTLLLLVGSVVTLSLGLSKIVLLFNSISPFLKFPVFAVFGSLIAVMIFNINVALFITIIISFLMGLLFSNDASYIVLGLIGGFSTAFYGHKIRRRGEFIKAGMAAGMANFVVIISFGVITNVKMPILMYQGLGGAIFGVGAVMLAAAILPVYEYLFGVTTNISLVELSDFNHPLLKRLVMEAPGTYHHSLVVGNLAEAAAEAVDANPLLARVASYFHDIGKLKKPLYFSENEAMDKSRHDSLQPSMSSLIIISHVKDGIDLARQNKLNRRIIEAMKQHHGTSCVYYFYRRALEHLEHDEKPDETDFRYPGPKPQTKEAAIIMLADSVEATSRSLDKPNAARIESMVKDIFEGKVRDGQLDECTLTFRDLSTIGAVFTKILLGTLHARVKYPAEEKKSEPPELRVVNRE